MALAPDQPHPPYLYQTATVPANASRVGATVRFYKTEHHTQIQALPHNLVLGWGEEVDLTHLMPEN